MSSVNFNPIKNNCQLSQYAAMKRGENKVPPVTTWGKALEALRERRSKELGGSFTQYKLAQAANLPGAEYRNMMRHGVHGPSVMKIDTLLRAMKYTWIEWGVEFESILKQEAMTASIVKLNAPVRKNKIDKEADSTESKKNFKPIINH